MTLRGKRKQQQYRVSFSKKKSLTEIRFQKSEYARQGIQRIDVNENGFLNQKLGSKQNVAYQCQAKSSTTQIPFGSNGYERNKTRCINVNHNRL
jgi:hypothetical protein